MLSPHTHTHTHYEVMDMSIGLILVIIVQCICISKHQVVQLKYIQFFLGNYTSVELKKAIKT